MNNEQASVTGVYSNSGFDMIQVLSRVINRFNPQVQLGPVDFSCSFVVSDARQLDCPVVYCSPAFEKLTKYTHQEIVGRNCRFLQSPSGNIERGTKRIHTDNQAVYYLKNKINQGKEHQTSIINYRKDGQPFVNLVTVVPLFDTQNQIEYFVGFQVDLVEQPNSILEKMKDGTYIINYHQIPKPTAMEPSLALLPTHEDLYEIPVHSSIFEMADISASIASLLSNDVYATPAEALKAWNKQLIDQCADFIFVISLKGLFLYASDSSLAMLEHSPNDLLGTNLSTICHPCDIIPVMREIKEATTRSDPTIDLIFRIRRKYSGYMWIDCRGVLHMDQTKNRKCFIVTGRERPVYQLFHHGGEEEGYWAKLSIHGLYLHVTASCKDVVGFTSDSLEFESIYQYTETTTEITMALELAREGKTVVQQLSLLTQKGIYVSVWCTFHPGDSFILLHVSPQHTKQTTTSKINVFKELETTRSTNWQYELYQIQQKNKKLKEQLDHYTNRKKVYNKTMK